MRVVWDPQKAEQNLRKHGVRFSDAELALFDPNAVTIEDSAAEGEQRFITVGTDGVGRILVVVFTDRSDEIRLISARPASRRERSQYEEGL